MKPRNPKVGTTKWVIEAGQKARRAVKSAENPPKVDHYDAVFKGFDAHKRLFHKKKPKK